MIRVLDPTSLQEAEKVITWGEINTWKRKIINGARFWRRQNGWNKFPHLCEKTFKTNSRKPL
jgi:hypothetical protein